MIAILLSALLIITPIDFDDAVGRASIDVSADVADVRFNYTLSDGTATYGAHYTGTTTGSRRLRRIGSIRKIRFDVVPNTGNSPSRTLTLKIHDISQPGFPDTVFTTITINGDYTPIVIIQDTLTTPEGSTSLDFSPIIQ